MISIVAAAADPVVTLDEAKARLHIDHVHDDLRIRGLIEEATAFVADQASVVLGSSTLELGLAGWSPEVAIPAKPVRTIVNVRYIDAAGIEQTVNPANYYSLPTDQGATLYLLSTFTRPTLRSERKDAVRIRFQCGYAADDENPNFALPPQARTAILLLVGSWYLTAEDHITGTIVSELPIGVARLLAQLRVYR
ncbi:MAG: phage gp6-like head-tail connector protein [Xanthobacteraceae bacterium]|jgi:uncharacterized phiE125 gp8 family phage protein|nr:phage gp6-like head-tail connector protein [Xanthobacteraceae bacterium]